MALSAVDRMGSQASRIVLNQAAGHWSIGLVPEVSCRRSLPFTLDIRLVRVKGAKRYRKSTIHGMKLK